MLELHELGALAAAWCCVALLAASVWALLRRCPEVPAPTNPPPEWSGHHLAAAFLVFWLMPALALPLISPDALARWCYGSPVSDAVSKSLTLAAASLLTLPLQLAAWYALAVSAQVNPPARRTMVHWLSDTRSAMKTWLALTPIVFVVFVGSVLGYTFLFGRPEEHPLLAPFQGATPLIVVMLLAVEAIIAAPIREELLFRGVLLPWMAARDRAGDGGMVFAALAVPLVRWLNGAEILPVAASGLASTALAATLWIASRLVGERWISAEAPPESDSVRRRAAVRAVFGSAAIFAVCHWAVPPTPVPLAVLAVGLGFLALRTQGVFAPILVHALFNAVAFMELVIR